MTSTLIAPENETFPNRKRWTRQQCERLVESGELVGRYELIDGAIISKMGQNPPHRIVIRLLAQWLIAIFGVLCVQTEAPIAIPGDEGATTEPEPDVAVTLEPTTAYTTRHPGTADLLIVIEVSDTAYRFDTTTKALLYARVGIREYWVMDVVEGCIYIHQSPTPEGYADVTTHDAEATVSLINRPDTAIQVSALFRLSNKARNVSGKHPCSNLRNSHLNEHLNA